MQGPKFKVEIYRGRPVELDIAGYIRVLGMSAQVRVKIGVSSFELEARIKLNIFYFFTFEVYVLVDGSSMENSSFDLYLRLSTESMDKLVEQLVAVLQRAKEEASAAIEEAKEEVRRVKEECKEALKVDCSVCEEIKCAEAVEDCKGFFDWWRRGRRRVRPAGRERRTLGKRLTGVASSTEAPVSYWEPANDVGEVGSADGRRGAAAAGDDDVRRDAELDAMFAPSRAALRRELEATRRADEYRAMVSHMRGESTDAPAAGPAGDQSGNNDGDDVAGTSRQARAGRRRTGSGSAVASSPASGGARQRARAFERRRRGWLSSLICDGIVSGLCEAAKSVCAGTCALVDSIGQGLCDTLDLAVFALEAADAVAGWALDLASWFLEDVLSKLIVIHDLSLRLKFQPNELAGIIKFNIDVELFGGTLPIKGGFEIDLDDVLGSLAGLIFGTVEADHTAKRSDPGVAGYRPFEAYSDDAGYDTSARGAGTYQP